MAQRVKRPTLAQVMISRFVGSSPTSGSVLTGQSLEPTLDSVSPSLSAPPPVTLCLCLSKLKKCKKKKNLMRHGRFPHPLDMSLPRTHSPVTLTQHHIRFPANHLNPARDWRTSPSSGRCYHDSFSTSMRLLGDVRTHNSRKREKGRRRGRRTWFRQACEPNTLCQR